MQSVSLHQKISKVAFVYHAFFLSWQSLAEQYSEKSKRYIKKIVKSSGQKSEEQRKVEVKINK